MKNYFASSIVLIMSIFLFSCSSIPKGVNAVTPFYKDKYLGKWYEIARFDFRFEKDLNNTTAEYSVNRNGSIRVVNSGYDTIRKQMVQAVGKAKFKGDENTAMLKVSFFGPFYAGYNVIAIDQDYKYALVCGQSLDYLWILARETSIPDEIRKKYLEIAQNAGFDIKKLLWIAHDRTNN